MLSKINSEIVSAMKSKDQFRRDVLRMIKSKIEEENKKSKNKRDEIEVICAYYTSLEKATLIKGISQDFIDKTNSELSIIKEFMPQEITVDEIEEMISEYMAEQYSAAPPNKGALISYVKQKGKELKKIVPGRIVFMAVDAYMKKD